MKSKFTYSKRGGAFIDLRKHPKSQISIQTNLLMFLVGSVIMYFFVAYMNPESTQLERIPFSLFVSAAIVGLVNISEKMNRE